MVKMRKDRKKKKKRTQSSTPEEIDYDILEIQEDDLLKGWMEQPRLMGRFTKLLAEAKDNQRKLSAHVKLVKAELDNKIRSNPKHYGLIKETEKEIEHTVLQQDKMKDAETELLDAILQVDLLQGLVDSLHDKKKGLEKIVDLWAMSYFSTPRAGEISHEKMEEMTTQAVTRRGRTTRKKRST